MSELYPAREVDCTSNQSLFAWHSGETPLLLGAMIAKTYDVFLSHNSKDKSDIEELARKLRKRGVKPWLDKWDLIPGTSWQPAIEKALARCLTCAVFIGSRGTGPWQTEEMRAAIDRKVQTTNGSFRVIPVLLPGAKRVSPLPTFLAAGVWVEFRRTIKDEDAFHRLVCGIRGVAPGDATDKAQQDQRVQVAIRLTCGSEQFQQVTTAAQEFLRKASGDATLTIKYLRPGSVIVVLECSEQGFERLSSMARTGNLSQVMGYAVESIAREPSAAAPSNRTVPASLHMPDIAMYNKTSARRSPHSSGQTVSQAPSRVNDSELIRAAQRGDRSAFEVLVRQYDQAVLRLALHLTGSEADARDIYQEAFLKAYRHIANFRFECSFYTWIYRIVTNLCLDHLRRRQTRREGPQTITDSTGRGMNVLDRVSDDRAGVNLERDLMRREMGTRIAQALARLTPRERVVFELKHSEGLQLRTIGKVLNTTEETAKTTLFRATQRFVQFLRAEDT